jgi:hypothetical protein
LTCVALPAHERPILRIPRYGSSCIASAFTSRGFGRKIGNLAGNGCRRDAERAGDRQERQMSIVRGQRIAVANAAHARRAGEQPGERLLQLQQHSCSALRKHP